jgi:aminopeptidase YwaD
MRPLILAIATAALLSPPALAQHPAETLLPRETLRALADELSGNAMKDHVNRLAQLHRVPASPGFHDAVEYIREQADRYGLRDVRVERFPANGTYFGTLRGNRGWRVEGGSLLEVSPTPRRIISYDDVRVAVADNSETADVTAEIVDAGAGTTARDYDGKDVRGKLVLSDGAPAVVHRLAVEERGASGLVSYNSNQRTAWWRDDPDLVRWGHLDANGRRNTFAIMISLREARALQQRLSRGERIVLQAIVRANNDDDLQYETMTATIPGSVPDAGDIVFSCHLDHQKPGANDNASGCSAILEIARALRVLIDAGRIARPKLTVRFVWPSEMIGTIALLTRDGGLAARIKAVVHLDMVGGDFAVTKSVLHVTRTPWSIAGATDDVAETFARYVIDGAYDAAAGGDPSRNVRAGDGSKDPFVADITEYEGGSDHWVYQDGSFRVPAVYLRDWPDIYIHTNKDSPDHVDVTKIKRSAFIAAASGYFLAEGELRGLDTLASITVAGAHARLADDVRRIRARTSDEWTPRDAGNQFRVALDREQRRIRSIASFASSGRAGLVRQLDAMARSLESVWTSLSIESWRQASTERRPADPRVPVRLEGLKGPIVPGAPWLDQKLGAPSGGATIAAVPRGVDVAWEITNFADGTRTVSDIRDAVSAEFGPVALEAVAQYLELLERAGVVRWKS